MKNVKIRNEWFEIIKPRKYKPKYALPGEWGYMNIWEAYRNPSEHKQWIWTYWNMFYGDEKYKFGNPFITSRNCFTFAIRFNVFDAETLEWLGVAVITKEHNRLYLA